VESPRCQGAGRLPACCPCWDGTSHGSATKDATAPLLPSQVLLLRIAFVLHTVSNNFTYAYSPAQALSALPAFVGPCTRQELRGYPLHYQHLQPGPSITKACSVYYHVALLAAGGCRLAAGGWRRRHAGMQAHSSALPSTLPPPLEAAGPRSAGSTGIV